MDTIKYLTKGASLAYSYFSFSTSTTKQLLDPLTTLLKIALLKYKPNDTRLSIHNHKIYFQLYNILQPAERTVYRDARSDLHNLCEPLIMAYRWYSKTDARIKYIAETALDGLEMLETSYKKKYSESDLIIHSLSHYKKIIKCIIMGDPLEEDYQEDKNMSQKFRDLWIDQEITVVYDLLILLDTKSELEKELTGDITTLETMLDGKDSEVYNLIKNMSISFSKSG